MLNNLSITFIYLVATIPMCGCTCPSTAFDTSLVYNLFFPGPSRPFNNLSAGIESYRGLT